VQLSYEQAVSFNRLSAAKYAKRRRSRKKKSFSDVEYPEVTSKMVGLCTTPSKSKGKQPIIYSSKLMMNLLLVWKKYWVNQKVYQHTRILTGTIALVNFSTLARVIEVNKAHPAIAESQASNSSTKKEAFAYMAGTPKEVAKRFEEQVQVQRE